MSKNPYESLGVSKTATEADIKSAYRKMAKKYHPDQNPGDKAAEAKFKEVNSAYEVLSDPGKKANYDRFGSADGPQFRGRPGGGAGGFGNMGGMQFDFGDLGDLGDFIFNSFGGNFGGDMFGGARAGRGKMRGSDIHATVPLSFKESCLGCQKTVTYSRMERCSDCNGTGARGGTDVESCSYCAGSGRVRNRGFGGLSMVTPCSACNGSGKQIKNKCGGCGGKGAVKRTVSYQVDIPAGIADGQTLNIAGEGDCAMSGGPDGMSGALMLNVRVTPHSLFVREDFDLYLDLPITFTQAILGCTVKIPTVDGTMDLVIAPYTQNGTRHILRGKGVKRLRQIGSGDLIVKIFVEIPKNLDRRAVDAVKAMSAAQNDGDFPKRRNYRERLEKL